MREKAIPLALFSTVLLGLLTSSVQSSRAQEKADPVKGRISGRVESAEGKPLSRVSILVFANAGGCAGSAMTDRSGAYTVEVGPGTYRIHAQKEGYLPVGYGAESSNGPVVPVTVEAGKMVSDITLRLVKGGAITGRILDEDGEPLTGTRVSAERVKDGAGNSGSLGSWSDRTDDRGVYRIYGLRSGQYHVNAQPEDRVAVEVNERSTSMSRPGDPTYYPGVPERAQATEVIVTEGTETADIDFKLSPDKRRVLIRGRVTKQDDGQPLSGGSVEARLVGQYSVSLGAVTDHQGRFDLMGVSAGQYQVRVTGGFLLNDGYLGSQPKVVTVGDDPVELNIEIERGAEISGKIVLEDGRVPENVQRMYLFLKPKPPNDGSSISSSQLQIDMNGNFTLKRESSGEFIVSMPLDNTEYFLRRVLREGVDVTQGGIQVHPGEKITNLVLVISDATATLRGQVLSSDGGEPIPGALVQLNPVNPGAGLIGGISTHSRTVYADQRGRYEIKGIIPGQYNVIARRRSPAPRGPAEGQAPSTNRLQSPPIDLRMREVRELNLSPIE
jgi:protocatechuate 3,4-dioxygenase beta subunit